MQLLVFKYEEENHFNDFRTVEIDGEYWFMASDVCRVLDIQNSRQAVGALDSDEKLMYTLHTSGQNRNVTLVNESGLYSLIFRSNKPTAKKFRKWVTQEVLPSIRQTGTYSSGINRLEKPDFITRYMENYDHVSKGYFSVINQLYIELYARLEHAGYQMPNKGLDGARMRPDVSVGKGFADYLRCYYPASCKNYKYYAHTFSDINKDFDARQYPNSMLYMFIEYVEDEWIPNCAHAYFKKKDLKALDYLPKLLRAS